MIAWWWLPLAAGACLFFGAFLGAFVMAAANMAKIEYQGDYE